MNLSKYLVSTLVVSALLGCKSNDASFENVAQLQELAATAYAEGDLHMAAGYWLDVSQAMPEHNEAWCQLGHIDYRLHRYMAAANAYKKCLAISPQNIAVWHSLTAVKLRDASETLLLGSAYLANETNENLLRKYQLLMRELLRLHGIADGLISEESAHEG